MFYILFNKRDFKEQEIDIKLNFVGLVRKVKGNVLKGCIYVLSKK